MVRFLRSVSFIGSKGTLESSFRTTVSFHLGWVDSWKSWVCPHESWRATCWAHSSESMEPLLSQGVNNSSPVAINDWGTSIYILKKVHEKVWDLFHRREKCTTRIFCAPLFKKTLWFLVSSYLSTISTEKPCFGARHECWGIVDCCETLGCQTAWWVLLTLVTGVGFPLRAALGPIPGHPWVSG